MIQITINGEVREIPANLNVVGLLDHLGLGDRRVAVEINRAIVPKSQHSTIDLNAGDAVEIVQAIGGG